MTALKVMGELDDEEETLEALNAAYDASRLASPRDKDGYTEGQREAIRLHAKHKPDEPCNCHNGIACIYVPFDRW